MVSVQVHNPHSILPFFQFPSKLTTTPSLKITYTAAPSPTTAAKPEAEAASSPVENAAPAIHAIPDGTAAQVRTAIRTGPIAVRTADIA
jgi:hypothetical protein